MWREEIVKTGGRRRRDQRAGVETICRTGRKVTSREGEITVDWCIVNVDGKE